MSKQVNDILKFLMKRHHLNGHELARQTGVPQQTIQRLISGETEDPKLSTLLPISEKFGLSIDQLIGKAPLPTLYLQEEHPGYPVPLINLADAVSWQHSIENIYPNDWSYWINSNNKVSDRAFAVKTIQAGIYPTGTILIIEPGSELQEGDFVLANLTEFHAPVIRKVQFKDKKIYLEQMHETHIQVFNPNTQQILGKITASQKVDSAPNTTQNRKNLFVGAISDGNQTQLFIQNEEGKVIGQGTGKTANLCHSVDSAWQAIHEAFKTALIEAGITINDPQYHFHAALGIKSIEMAERLAEFKKREHPFATLLVNADGYFSCLGAHDLADGAIIIVDEGVAAYQMESSECLKLGGWGFPHRDEGGGAWIGAEAVKHMFWWQDGDITPSPMLETIFLHFSNRATDAVEWAMTARPHEYAEIARIVIRYFYEHDPYAKKIMMDAGEWVTRLARTMEKRATNKQLPLCLLGAQAREVQPYLPRDIQQRLVSPKSTPALGALKLLRMSFT